MAAGYCLSLLADSWELPWCPSCKNYVFYARHLCPRCHKRVSERRPVPSSGEVIAHTVIRRAPSDTWSERAPYGYGLVRLAGQHGTAVVPVHTEGDTILPCGARVELMAAAIDGRPVVMAKRVTCEG